MLKRIISLIDLIFFYIKEVLVSNVKVALEVLTPHYTMAPHILRVGVEELTTRQICAANNLISMTPGTLCADYDEEEQVLFIHSMYCGDAAEEIDLIRNTYFKKIKNVF